MPGVSGVLVTEIAHRQRHARQRAVRQARFPFRELIEEVDFADLRCRWAATGSELDTEVA